MRSRLFCHLQKLWEHTSPALVCQCKSGCRPNSRAGEIYIDHCASLKCVLMMLDALQDDINHRLKVDMYFGGRESVDVITTQYKNKLCNTCNMTAVGSQRGRTPVNIASAISGSTAEPTHSMSIVSVG